MVNTVKSDLELALADATPGLYTSGKVVVLHLLSLFLLFFLMIITIFIIMIIIIMIVIIVMMMVIELQS